TTNRPIPFRAADLAVALPAFLTRTPLPSDSRTFHSYALVRVSSPLLQIEPSVLSPPRRKFTKRTAHRKSPSLIRRNFWNGAEALCQPTLADRSVRVSIGIHRLESWSTDWKMSPSAEEIAQERTTLVRMATKARRVLMKPNVRVLPRRAERVAAGWRRRSTTR